MQLKKKTEFAERLYVGIESRMLQVHMLPNLKFNVQDQANYPLTVGRSTAEHLYKYLVRDTCTTTKLDLNIF